MREKKNSKRGKELKAKCVHAFNPLDTKVSEEKIQAAAAAYDINYDAGELYTNRHKVVGAHAFPKDKEGKALDPEPFVRRVFYMRVDADHPLEMVFTYKKDPRSLYPLPATFVIR